jgi:hypothetical protein
LVFCQAHGLAQREVGSIASIDRHKNALIHFRLLQLA